ncbi:MAG: DNA repair protein RecN, partial [Desulfuromonas sp.]
RFEVVLETLDEPAERGLEKVEFRISANPGEPLMPLSKVVSGGELSRLMLALKRVAPEVDQVPTVIFDEVDAGIGGETATAVGRKLKTVSSAAQVICVTHLPQVAAFAERHYRVSKRQSEGRTLAGVEFLVEHDRVREMARMLAGSQITDQTLLHARELILSSCDLS